MVAKNGKCRRHEIPVVFPTSDRTVRNRLSDLYNTGRCNGRLITCQIKRCRFEVEACESKQPTDFGFRFRDQVFVINHSETRFWKPLFERFDERVISRDRMGGAGQ